MKKYFYLCLFMLLSLTWGISQTTVSGTVSSDDGLPLIGVSVQEKGTSNGVITDVNGSYSITVQDGSVLVFSYTGYKVQELSPVAGGSTDVVLMSGVLLDEAVITALGIKRSEKALSYSNAVVDGGNMEQARETNIANSLAGKVAGLTINRTATGAGGSSRIVIRGNNSINGNNQPLIVVDGIPINNDNLGAAGMWGGSDGGDGISSINPSDVENMTVLKGNAATALYGYRASNGVIMITTKSGSSRKGIGVEVNSTYQADNLINLYDFQNEYGHGQRGVAPTTQEEALANGLYAWGSRLDGSNVMQFDGVERPYSDVGDNVSRFYRQGNTFTNNLALTGGNDMVTYRLSGTALNNTDIIPNSGVNRYTFNFNANAKLSDKLSAIVSGTYVDENVKNSARLSDSPGNVNYTVLSLPASINVETLKGTTDKLGADENGFELQFNDNVFVTNPYWGAYQWERLGDKNRIFGTTQLSYQLLSNLAVRGKLSLDRFDRRSRTLEAYGTAFTNFGQLREENLKVQEINRELLLDFNQDFSDAFSLNLIIGGNQQRNFSETLGAFGNNFSIPFLHDIRNLPNAQDSYNFSAFAVNSLFGQAEIGLMNNLYLTGSVRNDWFSTLTNADNTSDNSSLYYGVGASWVFTDAFDLSSALDFGKLRVGYSNVGGATLPYQLALNYGVFGANNGQPLGGITSGSVPNKELQPSLTTEFEIGADVRLLNNRLGIDIAYYNRKTTNDIIPTTISGASGYGSAFVQLGEISNNGVELLLNVTPVRNSKFQWDITYNFAQNNNQVVRLLTEEADGEIFQADIARTFAGYIQHIEGMPYSQVVGFEYMRDDAGNIMYDENNLPLRGAELVPFGTGVHPTTMGLNNSIRFGNFSLSALVDMRMGGTLYSASNSFAYTRGLAQETLVGREDGNVGPVTLSDAANVQDYYQRIAGISEEFIYESNYAKFRELVLGYSIPASLLKGKNIQGASISLVGRNLGLLWNSVPGIDPESTYNNGNAQGLEMFGVPQTRSIGVNLNLKF